MSVERRAVSGHYAGAVTRLLAHWTDVTVAGLLLVLGSAAFDYVATAIVGIELGDDGRGPGYAVLAALWAFLYWWGSLATAGKTPGKALLGLRVVGKDGETLTAGRAAMRTLALPISYVLLGVGFVGILLGRERRALHDIVAGTSVVYDWGERTAELPLPISSFLSRVEQRG